MRPVRTIYTANSQHWVGDGFLVQPLFSHMGEDKQTDPFLMLDYAAPREFPPNSGAPLGVGQHPHKGFETVTICYAGEVAHRDSAGGGGVIGAGDVQWMTTGSGIIHEEFHSEAFSRTGGAFEMVQLWVNLPQKFKNVAPKYQGILKADIPVVELPEHSGHIRIIAGQYTEQKGPASTHTEMNVWDILLNSGNSLELNIPSTHTLSLVVLRGTATFNGQQSTQAGQLVSFENSAGAVHISAGHEEVKLLLLSGIPIAEPIVGYGPFVMNTQAEIRQAILEYNQGRFGQID